MFLVGWHKLHLLGHLDDLGLQLSVVGGDLILVGCLPQLFDVLVHMLDLVGHQLYIGNQFCLLLVHCLLLVVVDILGLLDLLLHLFKICHQG